MTSPSQVSDGLGGIDVQTLAVTVTNANEAPVIVGGATAAVNVAENGTAVTTVSASDPDAGAVLSYALVGGADQSKFTIDASGVLAFVAAPDFEAPGDAGGDNVYDVAVQVSDGLGGSDIPDACRHGDAMPTGRRESSGWRRSTASLNVAENGTAVMTVRRAMPDAGAVLTSSVGGADQSESPSWPKPSGSGGRAGGGRLDTISLRLLRPSANVESSTPSALDGPAISWTIWSPAIPEHAFGWRRHADRPIRQGHLVRRGRQRLFSPAAPVPTSSSSRARATAGHRRATRLLISRALTVSIFARSTPIRTCPAISRLTSLAEEPSAVAAAASSTLSTACCPPTSTATRSPTSRSRLWCPL